MSPTLGGRWAISVFPKLACPAEQFKGLLKVRLQILGLHPCLLILHPGPWEPESCIPLGPWFPQAPNYNSMTWWVYHIQLRVWENGVPDFSFHLTTATCPKGNAGKAAQRYATLARVLPLCTCLSVSKPLFSCLSKLGSCSKHVCMHSWVTSFPNSHPSVYHHAAEAQHGWAQMDHRCPLFLTTPSSLPWLQCPAREVRGTWFSWRAPKAAYREGASGKGGSKFWTSVLSSVQ